jgi:hypothetical protein
VEYRNQHCCTGPAGIINSYRKPFISIREMLEREEIEIAIAFRWLASVYRAADN